MPLVTTASADACPWRLVTLDRFGHVAQRCRDCVGDRRTGALHLVAHLGIAQGLADRGEARVERVGELTQRVVHLLALVDAERGIGVEAPLERSTELAETLADLVPLLLGFRHG